LAFNQLTTFADPTGTPIANCTLQAWVPGVWLATFTISYASALAINNLFKGHGPTAGDVVILKCSDLTHVWILGQGPLPDTAF
jgi:hypothetical protein